MNGITGTAMPYFKRELESEKIWDVGNYVAVTFIGESDAGAEPKGIPAAYEPPVKGKSDMYYLPWTILVVVSLWVSVVGFIWALKSGQFSDQNRARYLPLRDDFPGPPVEESGQILRGSLCASCHPGDRLFDFADCADLDPWAF